MNDYNFAIQAENLNKTYYKKGKKIEAIKDFNIKIPKNSIHGLLGPNGAGKSTFINMLGGLVKKDEGDVFICGINIDLDSKSCRKKIGIVPQELNIDPFFTPFELLELQAGLYGVSKKNRITKNILEKMRLWDQKNAYVRTLSGGMRRRLLIAKALVHSPEILILDEPTAGVDVELRKNLWDYVKELNKNGTTICLTTHYIEEAEKLCDNITIINNGQILRTDSKNNLLSLVGKKTVHFHLDESIKNFPEQLNIYKPNITNNVLTLSYDKNKTQLREILNIFNDLEIKFSEINTQESDLEEVFVELTNKK